MDEAVSMGNWFWMFEETYCLQNGGHHSGTDTVSHPARPKSFAMSLRELPITWIHTESLCFPCG